MPGIIAQPRPLEVQVDFHTDASGTPSTQVSDDLFATLQAAPGRDPSAATFAAVRLLHSTSAHPFFAAFSTLRVDRNGQLPPRTVRFVNNLTVARVCQGQCTVTAGLVVPVAAPLALTSLVLSTPVAVYDLLAARESRDTLVKGYLTDVVGAGYYVRELSSEVVMCEPLGSGIVTPATEITIVKQRAAEPVAAATATATATATAAVAAGEGDTLAAYFGGEAPQTAVFAAAVLDAPLLPDTEFNGYVNVDDLAALGCFAGDRVTLTTNGHRYSMRLHALVEPVGAAYAAQNTVYLSPMWFYNLGKPALVELGREAAGAGAIPVALTVTLARVASPVTLDKTFQQAFLSELKTHFQSPRVVCNGDLVPVPIDTLLARTIFDLGAVPAVVPSGTPDAIAWFQVVEVDGRLAQILEDGCPVLGSNGSRGGSPTSPGRGDRTQVVVDPTRTKMVQSGIATPRVPDEASTGLIGYLGLPRPFRFPPGAFAYAAAMRKIFQTATGGRARGASVLLSSTARGLGKTTLVRSLAAELGLSLIEVEAYDTLTVGNDAKTVGTLRARVDRTLAETRGSPSGMIVYLKHAEALCRKTEQQGPQKDAVSLKVWEAVAEWAAQGAVVVVSVNDVDQLSDAVRNRLGFEVEVTVPSEKERVAILRFLATEAGTRHRFAQRADVSYAALALASAGLTPRDLRSIVANARALALQRLAKLAAKPHELHELHEPQTPPPPHSLADLILLDGGAVTLTPADFEAAINDARNKFSDAIGAPRIPNVKWEDIGGLDMVKDEILDTIDMPLKHPELFAHGVKKRSGILFYGPPGTGKTLLAKAIATNFSLNFFSVKGPELLNMYIGESEANVRRVFQRARDARPCVVFFDELDSVAPKRGNQGDSGGVMDRIVSQLLAELDGMLGGGGDGVFVVGATNRPDLLDEALLRPGRFDKMLYLGISDTHAKQQKILEALTRKFELDPDVDLAAIAEGCPYTFTGADFYALCSDAMLNAMTRKAGDVDQRIAAMNADRAPTQAVSTRWWFDNVAAPADVEVRVSEADFVKARSALVPSVSAQELEHYLRVRQNFEGKAQTQAES